MKLPVIILVITAALSGLPAELRSEDAFQASISPRRFVDSRGDTIPTNPQNLPFRLVNGFHEYTVGPGDILQITSVQAGVRTTEDARILADGTLSFSVLTSVPIADLTLSAATHKLTEQLSIYVRYPQLHILVSEYLSKTISIFGAINASGISVTGERFGPGVYPLRGRITALEMLMEAGGPSPDARLDQVRLIRNNRTYEINLQNAITRGDNSQNIVLEHGDLLQVTGINQADRRVVVLGEVLGPGVFNLSSNADMLEVIATSRGFTQDARANRVRVIRTTDPMNPMVINVNAERILKGDLSQNVAILDGDIVVVPRDFLTDLNDIIAQISPIISWGGLATVEPLLSVGGYSINQGDGLTLGTQDGSNITLSPAEQALLQQVQANLRGGPASGNDAGSSDMK